MRIRWTLALILGGMLSGGVARGAIITVDESGNSIGTVGRGFIGNDPGPGGLAGVLIFNLPFAGVQGDVLMTDGGLVLDVVRFNGNGTLIFYSDNLDAPLSLADTPSPPFFVYTNLVVIPEIGPEGNNGSTYTPLPGQPGFNASLPTYVLLSDATIPEPSSIVMGGTGVLAGLGLVWRRRRTASVV